ncbi:hypothetical protein BS50DRAFT_671619 [Corynespora cassiicola Philippines]|uniref:Uncharacterized protein n=1 Tax=Corynespora cassiicola Philippines TaxID=1448308 RepID=A0A2T2PDS1_CORCC|nr:hypothetical protein BS50DRAFT_671619 [Corynespora cassiicola Philippines]
MPIKFTRTTSSTSSTASTASIASDDSMDLTYTIASTEDTDMGIDMGMDMDVPNAIHLTNMYPIEKPNTKTPNTIHTAPTSPRPLLTIATEMRFHKIWSAHPIHNQPTRRARLPRAAKASHPYASCPPPPTQSSEPTALGPPKLALPPDALPYDPLAPATGIYRGLAGLDSTPNAAYEHMGRAYSRRRVVGSWWDGEYASTGYAVPTGHTGGAKKRKREEVNEESGFGWVTRKVRRVDWEVGKVLRDPVAWGGEVVWGVLEKGVRWGVERVCEVLVGAVGEREWERLMGGSGRR